MLAATNVKMSGGKKKVDKSTYDISSMKRATEEVSGSLVIRPTDFFLGRFVAVAPQRHYTIFILFE